MTEPDFLQQVDRTYVLWKKARYSYFGGCDYFRLSSHARVASAIKTGLAKFGLTVAASRLTTGNHKIYGELETALAEFFDAPAALVVSSGYAANAVVAQALQGSFSRVLIDEKAHPSLHDASRQFRCLIQPFKHRDFRDLARVLARSGANDKPVLLTDGLFAHNGEIAPLAEYLKLMPAHGLILVDDAHAAGVLGKQGQGTLEFAGVSRQRVVQTITLSKAFGVYGGAILGTATLRERLLETPMFAGSTPLPPPLACGVSQAMKLLRSDSRLRQRLKSNVEQAKSFLRKHGRPVPANPAPMFAIAASSSEQSAALTERLLARKILPSFIRYPGGPSARYFRFALSSEHKRAQVNDLMEALGGE